MLPMQDSPSMTESTTGSPSKLKKHAAIKAIITYRKKNRATRNTTVEDWLWSSSRTLAMLLGCSFS